jgi:hypothetical protein
MDDDAKDVVKAGMEVILRPVTEIAENVLGLAGGDWLSEKRARNRERLQNQTKEILKERGIDKPEEPSPSIIVPLLTQAQDEGRDELLSLWAKLLAAAMDPARSKNYRREFVEIVSEMEPLDALVLPILTAPGEFRPSRKECVASRLSISADQVELSFRNLIRLEVAFEMRGGAPQIYPIVTTLGRALLMLLQ